MYTLRLIPWPVFLIILLAFSCKNKDVVSLGQPAAGTATVINKDTLFGIIKGTMLKDRTYYIKSDIVVNAGDTLNVQPGVKVIVLNAASFVINGIFNSIGTQSDPITFTSPANNQVPGAWGGLECDSSKAVTIKWTNIEYAGAPGDGLVGNTGTQYPVSCRKLGAQFDFEDSRIAFIAKDGLRLNACHATVLRSTFQYVGEGGGEAITVKSGVTGDFAYNYIWSSASNGMDFETSTTVLYPQTVVNVYNNTIINNGWRNTAKPGNGILIDQFTRADVFNNIIVNGRQGLRITSVADTANTKYGNNLFFATIDSLKAYFYPVGDPGSPRSTDLIMVDPMFMALDHNINNTVDNNDAHLLPGSPALGKGNAQYNNDIGAYTSDGKGHR